MNRKILDYLSDHSGAGRGDLSKHLPHCSPQTVNYHISGLIDEGRIRDGLHVTDVWKAQLLKSYIFIETRYQEDGNTAPAEIHYQRSLVGEIESHLRTDQYRGKLFLDSIEIVIGAEFDIILILRAHHVYYLGSFVTGFLRCHRFIHTTHTSTALPSQPPPPDQFEDNHVEAT